MRDRAPAAQTESPPAPPSSRPRARSRLRSQLVERDAEREDVRLGANPEARACSGAMLAISADSVPAASWSDRTVLFAGLRSGDYEVGTIAVAGPQCFRLYAPPMPRRAAVSACATCRTTSTIRVSGAWPTASAAPARPPAPGRCSSPLAGLPDVVDGDDVGVVSGGGAGFHRKRSATASVVLSLRMI